MRRQVLTAKTTLPWQRRHQSAIRHTDSKGLDQNAIRRLRRVRIGLTAPPPTPPSQSWLGTGLCNLAEQGGFCLFLRTARAVLQGPLRGFTGLCAPPSQGVRCEGEFGDNRDFFAKTAPKTGFLPDPVDRGVENISNIRVLLADLARSCYCAEQACSSAITGVDMCRNRCREAQEQGIGMRVIAPKRAERGSYLTVRLCVRECVRSSRNVRLRSRGGEHHRRRGRSRARSGQANP